MKFYRHWWARLSLTISYKWYYLKSWFLEPMIYIYIWVCVELLNAFEFLFLLVFATMLLCAYSPFCLLLHLYLFAHPENYCILINERLQFKQVSDLGPRALAISLPFSCVLGFISTMIASTMGKIFSFYCLLTTLLACPCY